MKSLEDGLWLSIMIPKGQFQICVFSLKIHMLVVSIIFYIHDRPHPQFHFNPLPLSPLHFLPHNPIKHLQIILRLPPPRPSLCIHAPLRRSPFFEEPIVVLLALGTVHAAIAGDTCVICVHGWCYVCDPFLLRTSRGVVRVDLRAAAAEKWGILGWGSTGIEGFAVDLKVWRGALGAGTEEISRSRCFGFGRACWNRTK